MRRNGGSNAVMPLTKLNTSTAFRLSRCLTNNMATVYQVYSTFLEKRFGNGNVVGNVTFCYWEY